MRNEENQQEIGKDLLLKSLTGHTGEWPQLFLYVSKALMYFALNASARRDLRQHLVQWVPHLGVNTNHQQNFKKTEFQTPVRSMRNITEA